MNHIVDIDNLVRGILEDLAPSVSTGASNSPVPAEPKGATNRDSQDVYIDSRVVSLGDLKARLGGAKRLFISPKSILTPSARDEIRKQGIELAVQLPDRQERKKTGLWIASQDPVRFSPVVLRRLQADFEASVQSFTADGDLLEAARSRLVENAVFGIALTCRAATILYRANRLESIRAIMGLEMNQAAEDAAEIDANFLVLHPGRIVETKIPDLIKRILKK